MGIIIAIKAFCGALASKEASARIEDALAGVSREGDKSAENPDSDTVSPKVDAGRSEALELLATLQREARFIDFIKESLDNINDADVGAAARSVHDRCSSVLERCFEIRSLANVQEGDSLTLSIEEASNRTRFQFTGGIKEDSTVSGLVVHSGWVAQKCSTPRWSGAKDDELVLAPVVVEN